MFCVLSSYNIDNTNIDYTHMDIETNRYSLNRMS